MKKCLKYYKGVQMGKRRVIVSVIGNAACWYENCSEEDKKKWNLTYELGKVLVDNGYRVLTGGGLGVMRAAMAGAHASEKYREGDTIAIGPSYDENEVNDFADIVIATGLDGFRDNIVANSPVVVAMGGGSGTLREICSAWKHARLVIAYSNVAGWSAKVAGAPLDGMHRYAFKEDKIFAVENAEQVVEIIKKWLPKYNKVLKGLELNRAALDVKKASNWVGPEITTKLKKLT